MPIRMNIGNTWEKQTMYDPYSHPLESVDATGLYTASKMDVNNQYYITSISGANYESFFHTSFEDVNQNYFGGEVKLASGTIDNTTAHTGNFLH